MFCLLLCAIGDGGYTMDGTIACFICTATGIPMLFTLDHSWLQPAHSSRQTHMVAVTIAIH